jgi:hypothetical protein
MAPSPPDGSGDPTRGLGRSGGEGNIHDYLNKPNASTNVDPDEVVARVLGAPKGLIAELREEIEDAFEGHATGLVHLVAFVLNYGDKPLYNKLIEWVRQNRQRLLNQRVPKYITKRLQVMAEGGCKLLWGDGYVTLSEAECIDVLRLITAVLYAMVRVYDEHGVWHVIGGGSEEGDIYVTLGGDGHGEGAS